MANLIVLASATQTVSGGAAPVNVPEALKRLEVDINVTAASGTTPTLDVFVEGLDANGVWFTLWHPTQITGAIATAQSIGPGGQTPLLVPDTIRVRWVIGGTTPSFTFSISVIGQGESV